MTREVTYTGIVLAIGILCLSSVALAQDTRSETSMPTTDPTTRQVERAEVREERRVALTQQMQDRITNLAQNVENRLTAAIGRMENIISRLDSRIEKLNGMDVNTTEAVTKLADAQSALDAARNTISEIGSVQNAVSGDSPRESFASIRMQFIAARDLLKQTHEQLRETLALLKEAVKAAELERGVSDAVAE